MKTTFIKVRDSVQGKPYLIRLDKVHTIRENENSGFFNIFLSNSIEVCQIISANGAPMMSLKTVEKHLDIVGHSGNGLKVVNL